MGWSTAGGGGRERVDGGTSTGKGSRKVCVSVVAVRTQVWCLQNRGRTSNGGRFYVEREAVVCFCCF